MDIDNAGINKDTITERHNLRKQLKLLMLSNMKMKKQVKACVRIRILNRLRLEEEVRTLNNLTHSLAKHVHGTKLVDKINTANFMNPVQLADRECITVSPSERNKSDEYKFYCDKCSFKCKKKTPFSMHMRRHERVRLLYSCGECRKTFVTPAGLKMHQQKHRNGKPYSCDQCSYITHNSHALVTHKERSHLTCKTYSCNTCHYTTQDRSQWSDHKVSNPTHSTDTQCSACKTSRKRLRSEAQPIETRDNQLENNDNQITIHTCGKRWNCQHCGLLFKRRDSLKKHTAKHTGERKYLCDVCDYSAITRDSLTVHMRKHSGEKPFHCSECPFSCSTRSYLTVHMNKHLGLKPYGCDLCSFRSADSSKISSHKKRMHETLEHNATTVNGSTRQSTKMMCKHCGRLFHTMGALLRHEKEHDIVDEG